MLAEDEYAAGAEDVGFSMLAFVAGGPIGEGGRATIREVLQNLLSEHADRFSDRFVMATKE